MKIHWKWPIFISVACCRGFSNRGVQNEFANNLVMWSSYCQLSRNCCRRNIPTWPKTKRSLGGHNPLPYSRYILWSCLWNRPRNVFSWNELRCWLSIRSDMSRVLQAQILSTDDKHQANSVARIDEQHNYHIFFVQRKLWVSFPNFSKLWDSKFCNEKEVFLLFSPGLYTCNNVV